MIFRYEAATKNGEIVNGEFQSLDKKGVIDYLEKKGLSPISVREAGSGGKAPGQLSFQLFERVTPLDRIFLVRNLAAMIKAGVNLSEALDILLADATKKRMRAVLSRAQLNLQSGQPLSVTFANYKKFFPPVFVGMLKAGEASGQLSRVLDELGRYMTRDYGLFRKVKSALTYPLLLLFASIGVILLLLIFVLPRLSKIFQQSGVELPLITKTLVAISKAVAFSPILDLAIIAGLTWFFIYFRKTNLGQRFSLWIISRVPVAKELIKKVALVKFTRTLGSLISGGIPFMEALQLTAKSVGNDYYEKAISESAEQVKNGIPFSKTFANYPDLFPRFLISLIAIGEKTGTMDNILKTFADFYDEEVDQTLRDLTNFLEPLLLLIMGLIIGAITLSILLPIYQLVGKFGR